MIPYIITKKEDNYLYTADMYKAPETTKNKEQRDKGHIQFLKLVSAKALGFLHIM